MDNSRDTVTVTQYKNLDTAGIVLNGGRSSRMGVDKAALSMADGQTMLAHIVKSLSVVCRDVFIVGGDLPACDTALYATHIPDDVPGQGPLGGLVTIFRRNLAQGYLVLTCDQPFVTHELLTRLLSGSRESIMLFRVSDKESFLPFPGYYPQTLFASTFDPPDRDVRSMKRLVEMNPVGWVDLSIQDAASLIGANTPEEFADLRNQTKFNRGLE